MPRPASLFTASCLTIASGIFHAMVPVQALALASLSELSGKWRGSGTVHLTNGEKETIKCRATYAVNGANFDQTLKCGNPRYSFDVSSDVTQSGGQLSGKWKDAGTEDSGRVSGTISGDLLVLDLTGSGFTGNLSIAIAGCSQAVNLRPNSSTVSKVTVELRKRGCE